MTNRLSPTTPRRSGWRSLLPAAPVCALLLALGGVWAGLANGLPPVPAEGVERPVRSHIDVLSLQPGGSLRVAGWIFGGAGLRDLSVVVNGQRVAAVPHRLLRTDVAQAHPDEPDAAHSGFDSTLALPQLASELSELSLEATDVRGRTRVLRRETVGAPATRALWQGLLRARGVQRDDMFFLPIATSNVAAGGAEGVQETFAAFDSATVKVAIRVQILYLRTTRGRAGDYAFDPDFATDKRCGNRLIAEDSLNSVIRQAVAHQLPVLFTLNGGIWADSTCDAPEWDINDVLERDDRLVQWNQASRTMPDNHLSNLPGSFDSPELARSLTLNVYAEPARRYKKRNLQQAAAAIAAFAQTYPHLFVGVNLDADVYMNPFFQGRQFYDYNPDTVRQFREWLQGTGPYADGGAPGGLDLSRHRRRPALSLAEVDALTGTRHAGWDAVGPPRDLSRGLAALWRDPWYAEWERFRRHLVGLHYDELSQWTAEAGIDPRDIYSSQGFAPPTGTFDPVPVRIDSPVKNYDTAGVSIEGSAPSHGHLGAIVYGDSAINAVRMEGSRSLFDEFRARDPDWGIVEYNTADLDTPRKPADYRAGYRSLREIGNHGARLLSPMAWNGSHGSAAGTPGFVSYTSLRGGPLEQALQDFMQQRAEVPRSTRLWEFGTPRRADADGWQYQGRPAPVSPAGGIRVRLDADGQAELVSPPGLDWRADSAQAVVLQATADGAPLQLQIEGQAARASVWSPVVAWRTLPAGASGAGAALDLPPASPLGVGVDAAAGAGGDAVGPAFDRIRIHLRGTPGAVLSVGRIALYPRLRSR